MSEREKYKDEAYALASKIHDMTWIERTDELQKLIAEKAQLTKELDNLKVDFGNEHATATQLTKERNEAVANLVAERDKLTATLEVTKDVVTWAQCMLTALNVGDCKSESPLHKKLREVMIAYRAKKESVQ